MPDMQNEYFYFLHVEYCIMVVFDWSSFAIALCYKPLCCDVLPQNQHNKAALVWLETKVKHTVFV